MSRHAYDHRELDDVSQWDSAQALDDSDDLLAIEEQQSERSAARAVIAFIATAVAALVCALAII